ncbi:hypothetical protein [Neobacillus sp. Marseille-QA0830]
MNHILLSIQLLCLAIIAGGGIVLGGGLRPQFIKAMAQSKAVHELEALHIHVWNAYNRFSFIAAILLLLTQVVSINVTHQFQVLSSALSVILVLLFMIKLTIDARLRNRATGNSFAAGTVEQKNDHKKVEMISIGILILSTMGIFFIH